MSGFDVNAEVAKKAKAEGTATLGSKLIAALAPGSVICIASSVSPELCPRMDKLAAEKGCGVLDTPVVLGQEAADNGQLVIYTGGDQKWVERAKPALEAFGKQHAQRSIGKDAPLDGALEHVRDERLAHVIAKRLPRMVAWYAGRGSELVTTKLLSNARRL